MKRIIFLSLFFLAVSAFGQKIWTDGKQSSSGIPTVNLPDFSALSEALADTVVNIYTTQIKIKPRFHDPQMRDLLKFFFKEQPKGQSLGSGVIISKEGYILTNYHVVKNADVIRVKPAKAKRFGNKGYAAKLIGRDPELDIALLKIDVKKKIKFAPLGDSVKTKIGEWVVAMGNPLGLGQAVTKGIITAKHRVIGSGAYDNYLQTDAPINQGNSGGPLFNLKGEVVGINTIIIPKAQSIGFAIPVNMIKDILPQLVKKGMVSRGFIGVGPQPLTIELKQGLGFPEDQDGVLVQSVEDGLPADKAGIKPGDIITKFNNQNVDTRSKLLQVVGKAPVGKTVNIEVFRKGKTKKLKIVLVERTEHEKLIGREKLYGKKGKIINVKSQRILGMQIVKNSKQLKYRYNLPISNGLLVLDVEEDSPAYEAGIERGDIIDSMNGKTVNLVSDIKKYIRRSPRSQIMKVRRGMESFFTSIRLK